MLFNFDQCRCLNVGHGNPNISHRIGECGIAALNANIIFGLIRRNIAHREEEFIIV